MRQAYDYWQDQPGSREHKAGGRVLDCGGDLSGPRRRLTTHDRTPSATTIIGSPSETRAQPGWSRRNRSTRQRARATPRRDSPCCQRGALAAWPVGGQARPSQASGPSPPSFDRPPSSKRQCHQSSGRGSLSPVAGWSRYVHQCSQSIRAHGPSEGTAR